jgi:hypothetical protein
VVVMGELAETIAQWPTGVWHLIPRPAGADSKDFPDAGQM